MDAKPDSDQKRMTEQAQALLAGIQAALNSISATESALRDNGFALHAPGWDLMAFLEDFGPMRPAELLRRCILTTSPATLSTILSRLEKRGLVVRVPDETDARSVIVDVTPGRSPIGQRDLAHAVGEDRRAIQRPLHRGGTGYAPGTYGSDLMGPAATAATRLGC